MRVAFYAPLKPPEHGVPSGDRRVARYLLRALARTGHDVEVASTFRSFEGRGDADRQRDIESEGRRIAGQLTERYLDEPAERRPNAWLTYHLYHKAPDWLGPAVCGALDIPYVLAEASFAPKQAAGPWAAGHAAVGDAIARADHVLFLNPDDRACVLPLMKTGAGHGDIRPFLEAAPYAAARAGRSAHRTRLAGSHKLLPDRPWLLSVGMMRSGHKLESYRLLGAALADVRAAPWHCLVVGDGPAREAVAKALRGANGDRVRYAGVVPEEDLPPYYAAADLFVWPAAGEAFGMAILEAQAAGLPVVAGRTPGVETIVDHAKTGLVTKTGDPKALAAAVRTLLGDEPMRRAMSDAAIEKCARDHDIAVAAARLDGVLAGLHGRAAS